MNGFDNPTRHRFTVTCFIVGLCFVVGPSLSARAHADSDQPNILLIMADDVGIEGFGCYGGSSYNTPNVDRLAAEGMRFTHAYSQPLCTPTRVQLMTGKYNHRNWKAFGILDPTETTFGHRLQEAGYTTGIFGKWQLQSYDPVGFPGADQRRSTGMHPKDAGFDQYALFHSLHTDDKGSRYAHPTMLEGEAGSAGELKTYEGRYGPDVWAEKVVSFFDRKTDQPKFVYYPMALPHRPFEPTPRTDGWQAKIEREDELRFAADMIEYTDVIVGKLIDGLRAGGHLQNTIVMFYSDNGTHTLVTSRMDDGRDIQGGKASVLQTGIHVPLVVFWQGHIDPSVCDDLVDASDFFPTLCDLAKAKLPDGLDGTSFAPTLFGRPSIKRSAAFFWYDPRPGWDKERFGRHVFAINKTHKYFRSGDLFRLTDQPLEEVLITERAMSDEDRESKRMLAEVIEKQLGSDAEPPLVDAFGQTVP